MHNNMVTINGQKMGKSLGNFITLNEFFNGEHELLERPFSPMTIRFFTLQAHYRSPLDFSNEALEAAEKGFEKLLKAGETLDHLKGSDKTDMDIDALEEKMYDALNDDLNTPVLFSHIFEMVRFINSVKDGNAQIKEEDISKLKKLYNAFVYEILGLEREEKEKEEGHLTENLIELLLNLRLEAKKQKDFKTADRIRDDLQKYGVIVKDTKDGYEWEIQS
jgi:cysteinyl-tRNA synthetase